tara:strand:+ start:944 stop:2134 length:1191 start_codon:yes stop_codon:yes gene_type:complete
MPKAFNRIKPEQVMLNELRSKINERKNPMYGQDRTQILYTGVVTFVDLVGLEQPLYSCRIDLDHESVVGEITMQKWFKPLMPIHFMRIPQRFERVSVIFSNLDTTVVPEAYWVSRVEEQTAGAQKVSPVDGSAMEQQYSYNNIPYQRGTAAFDQQTPPTNLYKTEPKEQLKGTPNNLKGDLSRYYKAVPGDVVALGGYNTAIRQTYNLDSAKGEMELISGYANIPNDENILTAFKNPMESTYSSRIAITTQSATDLELNQDFNLQFDDQYNLYGPGAGTFDIVEQTSSEDPTTDSFLLLQTTGHIRLISNASETPISHITLAEPLARFLTRLIDRVSELNKNFANHVHNHPMGPTIGPAVTPLFAPIDSDVISDGLASLSEIETLDDFSSSHVAAN